MFHTFSILQYIYLLPYPLSSPVRFLNFYMSISLFLSSKQHWFILSTYFLSPLLAKNLQFPKPLLRCLPMACQKITGQIPPKTEGTDMLFVEWFRDSWPISIYWTKTLTHTSHELQVIFSLPASPDPLENTQTVQISSPLHVISGIPTNHCTSSWHADDQHHQEEINNGKDP